MARFSDTCLGGSILLDRLRIRVQHSMQLLARGLFLHFALLALWAGVPMFLYGGTRGLLALGLAFTVSASSCDFALENFASADFAKTIIIIPQLFMTALLLRFSKVLLGSGELRVSLGECDCAPLSI